MLRIASFAGSLFRTTPVASRLIMATGIHIDENRCYRTLGRCEFRDVTGCKSHSRKSKKYLAWGDRAFCLMALLSSSANERADIQRLVEAL